MNCQKDCQTKLFGVVKAELNEIISVWSEKSVNTLSGILQFRQSESCGQLSIHRNHLDKLSKNRNTFQHMIYSQSNTFTIQN